MVQIWINWLGKSAKCSANNLSSSTALRVDVATRIRHVLSGDPVDLNHVPCSEANLVVLSSTTSQAALKAVPVGLPDANVVAQR